MPLRRIFLRYFRGQLFCFVGSTAEEPGCVKIIIEKIAYGFPVSGVEGHCLLEHLSGLRSKSRRRKRVGCLRAPSIGPAKPKNTVGIRGRELHGFLQ